MPCIFCIAAIAIAATVIAPILVDQLDANLRTAAEDLRRVKDTQSIVMWTGSFRFSAPDGDVKTAATNITIYKASKRARIQMLTHELGHEDVHALQDVIANLLGATVLDRTDGSGSTALASAAEGGATAITDALPIEPIHPISGAGELRPGGDRS